MCAPQRDQTGQRPAAIPYAFHRSTLLASAALAVLVLSLTTAGAQPAPTELPEITVEGTSIVPVDASRVGSSVTIITARDIEERGSTSLPDVLRSIPGVAVNQSGGRGGLAQSRVRGAEANHTLVVIDGVPINDVNNGDADLANLPLDAIERIEVIRGPQSGIWGPNAHSGVINIVTRSGKGLARPELNARIEGGSFGTLQGSVSVRGASGPVYGALSISGLRTHGTVIAEPFGTERKGSSVGSLNTRIGADLSDQFNVEGTLRLVNRLSHYAPGDFMSFGPTYGFLVDGPGRSDIRDLQGRLVATLKMLEGRWTHRFSVDTSQQSNNSADAYTSDFGSRETQRFWSRTERTRADYRTAITFETAGAKHTLAGGADIARERFRYYYESDGAFGPFINDTYVNGRTRDRRGLYGEYLLALDMGFSLSAALRHDWNSNFRNALTWRLTAAQRFENGTRLHASLGRGVTNPTFFEQFGFFANFIGNPTLRPESSIGWDAGIEHRWFGGALITDLTYFSANLQDEIIPAGFSVVNSPVATRRQGVEVSLTARPTTWLTLSGSYTYTDSRSAEQVGGATVFKTALRRPKHAASFSATAAFADNKGRFTVTVAHNGAMRDRFFGTFPASDVTLRSYTLVGAQLSYDISRNATAFVRGENVFGQRYQEVFGYRGPGASVSAGLRVRLGD